MKKLGCVGICFLFLVVILAGCSAPMREAPPSPLPPLLQHKSEGYVVKQSPEIIYEATADELAKAKAARADELAKQPKVTMAFTNRSLADALGDIQIDTEVNIIPADNVVGLVNCYMEDVPLESALDMLCFPGGYSWRKIDLPDGNFYYIVGSTEPGDPSSFSLIITEKIKTSRPAAEVYALLSNPSFKPFISISGSGAAEEAAGTRRERDTNKEYMPLISEPSLESHELVVVAPREIVERIKHDIKTVVDTPRKQIAIQVLFTEAQFDKGHRIGIDWSKGLDMNVGGTGTFTKGWNFGWQGDVMGQFLTSIQAMVRKGELELKDFPQVVATEGTMASINLQTQQWIRLEEPRVLGNDRNYYFRERTEKLTYGTILMVRPVIADNGDITLKLAVEVDDVVGLNEDGLPVVNRRAVTNEVTIASGETVVIGGLYRQLFKGGKEGLAALGQLPILDIPLSVREKSNETKELTVFITAKVLEPEWVGAPASGGEGKESVKVITETKEVTKEVQIIIPHIDKNEWEKALDRTETEEAGD